MYLLQSADLKQMYAQSEWFNQIKVCIFWFFFCILGCNNVIRHLNAKYCDCAIHFFIMVHSLANC